MVKWATRKKVHTIVVLLLPSHTVYISSLGHGTFFSDPLLMAFVKGNDDPLEHAKQQVPLPFFRFPKTEYLSWQENNDTGIVSNHLPRDDEIA